MYIFEHLISPSELASQRDIGDIRVVDCRFDLADPGKGRRDYLDGHIPNALYADLDRDLAAPVTPTSGRHPLPDVEAFAATLGSWGIHNDMQVVAYDAAGGALAARLWWMLRWLGHRKVAVLDGGLDAWIESGGSLEPDVPTVSPSTFKAKPDSRVQIDTEELLAQVTSGRLQALVDARDPRRFRGEIEPLDTVPGHIPGALNFPYNDSLGEDGRWQDPDALRAAWRALLGDAPPNDWAVTCGSGVTACHLVLSAELAGLRAPRLYVGSWSEWIRDPARPVVTEAARDDADTR